MGEDGLNSAEPPVDLSRITETFTKDVALQKKLYGVFLDDMSARLAELDQAVETLDYPELQRVGHSIKGTSATIGVEGMRVLAFEIENAAKAQNSDAVYPKATQLKEEYAKVRDFLQEFIASH